MIELTVHQDEILEKACAYLKQKGVLKLVIQGSAGTGKTTLVEFLIKTCIEKNIISKRGIFCTAPTHKAVKVLSGKIGIEGIEFKTIHAVLGIRKFVDYKTGEVTFRPSSSSLVSQVSTLIIDEASMLNEELLRFIEDADVRTIFLGDTKQINPVKEEESPVFFSGYETLTLKEIIRQKEGNPIISLSNDLSILKTKKDNLVDKKGILYTKDYDRIVVSLGTVNGTDELKYLAWTNEEVDRVNRDVRTYIYGASPNKVEMGETIVLDSGYKSYKNNEEVKVLSINEVTETFKTPDGEVELKSYVINGFKDSSGKYSPKTFRILHESCEYAFKKLKWEYLALAKKKKVKWKDYFTFVEIFAEFKYNHALTVHKSQGSTYKQTIVNVQDVNKNFNSKEKKRLFYTAVTRASDLLILYKA